MQDFDTVDTRGDMWFVEGEGLVVSFSELDDANNPVDPATHTRWLRITALSIHQEIPVDPAISGNWRITLTPEQLHPLLRMAGAAFSINDESGAVPVSLWAGVIRERNIYS